MASATADIVNVQCPACPDEIPVTVSCHIEGQPGSQALVCRPDMIDIWAHMLTHGIPSGTLPQSDP